MSAPTAVRPAPTPAPASSQRRPVRWVTPLASGASVLLAGACMVAVVQGTGWLAGAGAAVAVVVVLGIALQRLPGWAVLIGQLAGLLLVLGALFGGGIVPGPSTFAAFEDLLTEAGGQIDSGVAPVVATPGSLFLIAVAFGLIAVAVYAIAVSARAPAAAGVPLLCVVAVPAALSDQLLPWWAITCAVAGYGLLLVARDDLGRRGSGTLVAGGVTVVALAAVIGVLLGSAATVVGTAGRFTSGGGSGHGGGSIGLNPFTSLRGQLNESAPVELFRTTGLTRASYLRALTLSDYRANEGWTAPTPRPGVSLAGPLTQDASPGDRVEVRIENVGFRDYWLPLYGQPESVAGLDDGVWRYDRTGGIAYSQRPRSEDGWTETAVLPTPTAADLRSATGRTTVDPIYLNVDGVDRRVASIAADVTRGQRTSFDKAISLVEYFTGPQSAFRYSLQTAPGTGDDALVDFLTVGRTGYCEQFASAMAVMLRTQNVPARVAVGFTAGTDADGYRSVTTRDAHAWVEAWFPGYGWITFDPTPLNDGRTIVPPYVLEAVGDNGTGSPAPSPDQGDLRPGQEPAPVTPQDDAPQQDLPQQDTATDTGPDVPVLVPLLVVLVVALLGGPTILRTVQRRRRLGATAAGGPGAAEAAWEEVLATSRDRGSAIDPGDTVRGTARALVGAHDLPDRAQDSLRDLVRAVEAEWYGDEPAAPGALTSPTAEVLGALKATGPTGFRGLLGTLFPRSLSPRSSTVIERADA
ncbi:hypothetical protein GCM10009836_15050 [Pseudonocardia ailaonensis]|uniref:Transglutaminase-like domain-containing protein n=1 Tax=Pseudonocardia ailaonensis TaxID=367279 RepID=A0ABN2MVY6_9PSEU